MPEHFYGLYSQITSYGADSSAKTGPVGYYKHVEDANYQAGKLFERCLTREWIDQDKVRQKIDEDEVWQKIADCGAAPFVHTISCETISGTIYYTMIVREETLHEDVNDISLDQSFHTNSNLTKTMKGASTCDAQEASSGPASENRSHPQTIPPCPQTYDLAIENKDLRDHHSPNPQWLLCQPAFSTDPASKLSSSRSSSSKVSSSETFDSEIPDSQLSESLASILEISLSDPKIPPSPDRNIGIHVNRMTNCMDDVCFSCLEFNDKTATYYNTGCSVCRQTPTSTMEATDPETHAPVPAKTERSYIERLQELLDYNDTRPSSLGRLDQNFAPI